MSLAVVPPGLLFALGGIHRAIEWRARRRTGKYRSEFYAEVWREAAADLGASAEPLGDEILEIRRGSSCTWVRQNVTAMDDVMTVLIANNKPVVHRLLAERGLRVPKYFEFPIGNIRKAIAYAKESGGDWVVKPAANSGAGGGVTTGIGCSSDIFWAAARTAGYGSKVLLEQQVEGDVYRLLYLDGVLVDAVLRKPSMVLGDGKSSIRKLVRFENEARLKGGLKVAQTLLPINMDMRRILKKQELSLSSVPMEGTRIVLTGVINDNSAADNVAAGNLLCHSIIADGATAAATVGVRFAGVDLITRDPSVPLAQSGGVILEVNTRPGFYHHYYRQGKPCPVAKHVLSRLLEKSHDTRARFKSALNLEPALTGLQLA